MNVYRIEYTREALRALGKLDKPIRRRVQMAIDRLADNPRPPGLDTVKSMPGCFRMRVGNYRVVYEVRDGVLVVVVIDVGHRSEVYR